MLKGNLRCPNDKTHNRFIVSAHIVQDWVVDNKGNFENVETDCVEVTHEPDDNDCFQCAVCGAEAIVDNKTP